MMMHGSANVKKAITEFNVRVTSSCL